jgi:hypothetical protein
MGALLSFLFRVAVVVIIGPPLWFALTTGDHAGAFVLALFAVGAIILSGSSDSA